jgi:hypothetical protein
VQSLSIVAQTTPLSALPAGRREDAEELLADLYMAFYLALLQITAIE